MERSQSSTVGQKLFQYCNQMELRYTRHRLLIAEKLEDADRLLTAEEIWLLLKREDYGISICSVYTNLKVLVNWGFAIAVVRPNRSTCYQLITS